MLNYHQKFKIMLWISSSAIFPGSTFSGSSASLTNLNALNITTGTLLVNGSGLTSLNASNVSTGTLSVNGSGLSILNVSNATLGTLNINRGGIGKTELTANQILIGNGTTVGRACP